MDWLSPFRVAQRGFTLIETTVAVVIVAVLVTITLPAYNQQMIRTHRAAAQAEMMKIANLQQQFLLSKRVYMSDADLAATGYVLDADVASRYHASIALHAGAVPRYTLTFTASGRQASDGNLTLNEQGVGTPPARWGK